MVFRYVVIALAFLFSFIINEGVLGGRSVVSFCLPLEVFRPAGRSAVRVCAVGLSRALAPPIWTFFRIGVCGFQVFGSAQWTVDGLILESVFFFGSESMALMSVVFRFSRAVASPPQHDSSLRFLLWLDCPHSPMEGLFSSLATDWSDDAWGESCRADDGGFFVLAGSWLLR